MIEVPDSAFAPLTDRSKPLHCFDHEEYQYRVKVQAFSSTPPEITIQGISFERDQLAYRRAYENGAEHCFRRSGGLRVPAEGGPSDEDMERARRRAKTRVRKLVKELVPNHFTTFTIRESGPVYYTAEDWKLIWGHFVRYLRLAGVDFQYVSVLERHPTNPDHLHMHVAWRGEGFVNYNMLRRFWHMAIGKRAGVVVKKVLRGPDSLGNVQDRQIKASAGSYRHTEKIAKYIGKYITKDLISEFNKKRYWQSAGISIEEAQVYWLSALSMPEALREGCRCLASGLRSLEGRCRGFSTQVIALLGWRWIEVIGATFLEGFCPVSRRVALVVEHLCGPNQ